MKKSLVCILVAAFLSSALARAESGYVQYEQFAEAHQKKIQIEGYTYILGGGIGLGTSLALGIASDDAFSKIGYTLIEALSSASIFYGATLRSVGDDITQQAEILRAFDLYLSKSRGINDLERLRISDEATHHIQRVAIEHTRKIKRTRGYLELTTAASCLLSLGLSKTSTTPSNVGLGFIFLISTAGGLSDLLGQDQATGLELGLALQSSPELTLSLRW